MDLEQLRRAGLWDEGQAHREAARPRLREEGKPKQEAVEWAWDAMAAKYLPLAETAEPGFQTILPAGAESFDELVDRDYSQADDAAQMCDVYRWIRDEFPRIVEDRPAGTVVQYRRMKTPPPIALACNILETWAAKPRHKRGGLYGAIRMVMVTATAPSDSSPEEPLGEGDLYLASIGELDPDE